METATTSLVTYFGQMNDIYVNAIRTYLDVNGLVADDVDGLFGVRGRTVNRWLAGQSKISRRHYPKIREVCGQYIDSAKLAQAAAEKPLHLTNGSSFYPDGVVPNSADLRAIIAMRMVEEGITTQKLCLRMGYDRPQDIRNLHDGRKKEYRWWFPATFKALCLALELDIDTLPIGDDVKMLLHQLPDNPYLERPIPVMGLAAAASLDSLHGVIDVDIVGECVMVPTDGHEWGCLEIVDESAMPVFPPGTKVLGWLDAKPRPGDKVCVRYHGGDDEDDWRVMFKIFIGERDGMCKYESIGRYGVDPTVPRSAISWELVVRDTKS